MEFPKIRNGIVGSRLHVPLKAVLLLQCLMFQACVNAPQWRWCQWPSQLIIIMATSNVHHCLLAVIKPSIRNHPSRSAWQRERIYTRPSNLIDRIVSEVQFRWLLPKETQVVLSRSEREPHCNILRYKVA